MGRREQISNTQSLADGPEVFSRKLLAAIYQEVYRGGRPVNTQ